MTLIDILTVVVLILVSALIIFLIIYLGKITKSIEELQKDISGLSENFEPLINLMTEVTTKVSDLSDHAQSQLDSTKIIIENLKDRVDTILEFEENVRAGIQGPVMSFINQIKAISNGVNTFLSYLKK